MLVLLLLASQVIGQTTLTSRTLSEHDLPYSPLAHRELVLTGGGDGLQLDVVPSIDRAFDPNKEMPDFEDAATGRTTLVWRPTPTKYIVTDDEMIRLVEPRKEEPINHLLEVIRYREKMPWKTIDREIVLLFDHKVFAICIGDLENDSPQFHVDARLMQTGNKPLGLDIGQYMSGTGAFNSHSFFKVTFAGPVLTETSEGGRGR